MKKLGFRALFEVGSKRTTARPNGTEWHDKLGRIDRLAPHTGRHKMFTVNITGTPTTISTEADLDALVAEYRTLDAKGKAAIRKIVDTSMRSAVDAMNMDAAQLANKAGKLLVSPKATAPDVDPTEVLIDAVAELELAVWLLKYGSVTPAGLEFPDGFDIDAVEFLTVDEFTGDLAEKVGSERATSIDAGARAFATAKRTRSADRMDIGQVILSAFNGLESGAFLSVSEIANKAGGASTGAIAARLFPTSTDKKTKVVTDRPCTVEGIKAGVGGTRNVKGAYLI